jgi:hypothetical protein
VVPGQDVLLQLGIAGVFLIAVIIAVVALWKHGNARAEAAARERKESDMAWMAALERSRSEFFVELGKIRAEQQETFEQSRAEFLSELRRRDDALQSQQARFEATIAVMHRDNAAAVQAMHEKSDRSAQNFAAIADALSRRLTTQG